MFKGRDPGGWTVLDPATEWSIDLVLHELDELSDRHDPINQLVASSSNCNTM